MPVPAAALAIRAHLNPLIKRRGLRATARSVGVHHEMLIDWLAGRRDIGVDVLIKLASRFGLALELVDARPQIKVVIPRRRTRDPSSPPRGA